MNTLAMSLMLIALAGTASAQDVYHRGYVTRNGTYVAPHYQTRPDSNPFNNYSTRGNVNPYTGQPGTVDPYAQRQPSYATPQPTYSMPAPVPGPSWGRCPMGRC